MELALIPVAAILLLLSGASAPAQSQPGRLSAIALMRGLLGAASPGAIARPERRGSRAGSRQVFQVPTPKTISGLLFQKRLDAAQVLPDLARAATRKRFRTRFGFAEGAYFAIGPPLVGSPADLG